LRKTEEGGRFQCGQDRCAAREKDGKGSQRSEDREEGRGYITGEIWKTLCKGTPAAAVTFKNENSRVKGLLDQQRDRLSVSEKGGGK